MRVHRIKIQGLCTNLKDLGKVFLHKADCCVGFTHIFLFRSHIKGHFQGVFCFFQLSGIAVGNTQVKPEKIVVLVDYDGALKAGNCLGISTVGSENNSLIVQCI